eukprot:NODE_43493_length_204_cov_17.636364.p2 GENE.NODE_43493_length_204_cov_17.636364~~NODE_43493_length_204_cov_17.636364.p2  ORF type:complete len:54 (-),score=0.56 NODE_43493_length_204_cov_17.636364:13-174(-)
MHLCQRVADSCAVLPLPLLNFGNTVVRPVPCTACLGQNTATLCGTCMQSPSPH